MSPRRVLFVALLLVFVPICYAQNPTPAQLFTRLRNVSDKVALIDGTRPYHLVIDATIPVRNGEPERKGTIEVWRSGKDVRHVETFGTGVATYLVQGGKAYYSVTGDPTPDFASILTEAVEHPGPSDAALDNALPEFRKESFGGNKLECIMLDHKITDETSLLPLGFFPTYCMDAGNHLVLHLNAAGQNVIRQGVGNFLDHEVTTHVVIATDGTTVADGKVSKLTTFTPAPNEFEPSPNMTAAKSGPTPIDAGLIEGKRIGGDPLTYPTHSARNHISGPVILRMMIGRDGRIYSLEPLSAPALDLAIAAMAATRTWRYQPYMRDGQPVEVTTVMTIRYHL